MTKMFQKALLFNHDISKWDVSRVINADYMFMGARSFNGDISKWDVSSVTGMNYMFMGAVSYQQQLCGASWVRSKAQKKDIFVGLRGSISRTVCPTPSSQRWLARWQIASVSIATSLTTLGIASTIMACPRCGTFKKSGRVSCCATGGTWYKNCGDADNRNTGHSWLEGVEACKRKSKLSGCRRTLTHIK